MSRSPNLSRHAAIALCAALLGACGSPPQPGLAGPPGVRLASREAPAGGKWLAVQFHAHSKHSDDGKLSIAQMRQMAKEQGLDALSLSEHDTSTHFQDPEFQSDAELGLIRAYEWTSKGGHAGVQGASGEVIPWQDGKERLLSHVAAARETLIVHHPDFPLGAAWKGGWDPRATAIEAWNSFYLYPTNVKDEPLTFEHGIDRDKLPEGTGYHAQDLGDHLANEKSIRWWNGLLEDGLRIPITAASDFHRWPQHLASPCTLVYATGNTESAILEALRAGRSQGVQSPKAMRIDLQVVDEAGSNLAMIGDTVAAQGPIKIRATVTKGKGLTLTLNTRAGEGKKVNVPADPWTYETTLQADRDKADFVWARLAQSRWPNMLKALTSPIYFN